MKGIENVISNLGLTEHRDDILEAWNQAVEENKAEAYREAQKEYEEKLNEDKQNVVHAAESLVNDTLEKELQEFKEDKKKVYNAKKALLGNLKKARKLKESYDKKSKQRIEVFENFVMNTLKEEVSEFKQDRNKLEESVQNEKVKLKKERMRQQKLSENKEKALNKLVTSVLNEEITEFKEDREKMTENLNKMENLVINQITEELSEFQEDRQKLKEKRSELEHEYSKKLNEAKKAYVKRASESAETLVNETLKEELQTLKEDIHQAKENTFGRKLFEAFVSEFYHSHLSENTELSKISKKLEETNKNAEKLQKIVEKQRDELNNKKIELKEAKESSKRERKIDQLVKPLTSTKKNVMKELLEGVEYNELDKTFERYLPTLLEDKERKSSKSKNRSFIKEDKNSDNSEKDDDSDSKGNSLKEFTGKREKREKNPVSMFEEQEQLPDEEFKQMLINAGINKK